MTLPRIPDDAPIKNKMLSVGMVSCRSYIADFDPDDLRLRATDVEELAAVGERLLPP